MHRCGLAKMLAAVATLLMVVETGKKKKIVGKLKMK